MNHTTREQEPLDERCDCEPRKSIPFLDTLCTIKGDKIDTDLYKKDTDRNQYLLPSSCHPAQTTKAIPYSLSLRIVRICNDPKNRDKRLIELKKYLLDRGYSERQVISAIDKAKKNTSTFSSSKSNQANQGTNLFPTNKTQDYPQSQELSQNTGDLW